MITDKNFIKAFVGLRFFLWQHRDADQWIIYESLPEEGEGCRRKIISFDNETEAKKFFKAYKAKWMKFYKDNFKITGPDMKGNVPDMKGIRESSLKRLCVRKKCLIRQLMSRPKYLNLLRIHDEAYFC